MYNIPDLKNILKINYPDVFPRESKIKRMSNINTLVNFISSDISANKLEFEEKERRILLYTTAAGEAIYIQYPGMFSKNGKLYYDFRPIAVLKDGSSSINMSFEFIWKIIEKFLKGHNDFVPILNNILFRMGRMHDYNYEENEYPSFIVDKNGMLIKSDNFRIPLYKFSFLDEKIMESLNFHGVEIAAGDNKSMSVEAFLYYFELLIQIEDCKYNFETFEDEKGRKSTTDSLMIISSFFNNKIDLASILIRFVKCRGIARCSMDEYYSVTDGLVNIFNFKNIFTEKLNEQNIEYTKFRSGNFKIDDKIFDVNFLLNEKRLILGDSIISKDEINFLESKGYNYIDLRQFYSTGSLEKLITYINTFPDIFDFDRLFEKKRNSYKLRRTGRKIIINSKEYQYFVAKNNKRYVIIDDNSVEYTKFTVNKKDFYIINKKDFNTYEDFNNLDSYFL